MLRGPETIPAAHGTYPIRPEIPGDPAATLPAWADALGQHPVVYVSLGTAPLFNQPEKFAPLLAGLTGEAVEVVVTVGDLNDPAAFGELPPTVHVEKWLALSPLLPRCDAVLCHAGTGTTLAALAAGLPLVLVPAGRRPVRQRPRMRTGRRGTSPDARPGHPSRRARRRSTVLRDDSSERAAARTLAAEIAAMPSAAEVVNELMSIADRPGATA